MIDERIAVEQFLSCPAGFLQGILYPLELEQACVTVCRDRNIGYTGFLQFSAEAYLFIDKGSAGAGIDNGFPFSVEFLSDLQKVLTLRQILLICNALIEVHFFAGRPQRKYILSHFQKLVFIDTFLFHLKSHSSLLYTVDTLSLSILAVTRLPSVDFAPVGISPRRKGLHPISLPHFSVPRFVPRNTHTHP